MFDLTLEQLDSLVATLPPGKERADALNELATRMRETEEWARMRALGIEARELSVSLAYSRGHAQSYAVTGFVHYILSEFQPALDDCTEGLKIAGEDPVAEGGLRLILGFVHWSLGNFDQALVSGDRSLRLVREVGDWILEGFGLGLRGGVLNSIGDHAGALLEFERSLAIFREKQHFVGVMRAYSGMGSALQGLGRLGEAEVYHRLSLETAERAQHQIGISRVLNDLGEIALVRGDVTAALAYHERSLEIRRRDGYSQAATTSLLNLGRVHRKLGDTALAVKYLLEGVRIAESLGARPKTAQLRRLLSEIYEETGDFARALEHFKGYETVRAELATEQAVFKRKALDLEMELTSARKDAEIHRLRNVELAEVLDRIQHMQAELVNSEKMAALGSLVAALAHEINSPLGVIRSASDVTMRCAAKSGDGALGQTLRTNAGLIGEATARIQTLINRLKNVAGLDQAEYKNIDVHAAIEDAVALLDQEAGARVTVRREFGSEVPKIYCYAAGLCQVFMHLLRNAMQAIDGPGSVTIRTMAGEEDVRIEITDTGRGVPPELLPRLFNPSFTNRDHRVQASFSLFTCLTIVQRHDGDIRVSSRPGEGATFTVVLPRSLETRMDDVALRASGA